MSSGAGDRVLVELNASQLKLLATAVHAQELQNLQRIHFKSHLEQLQYLNSSNDSNKTIEEVLKKVETMKSDIDKSSDETKKSMARDVYGYALYGVSLSLQLIKSYDARKTHLQKLNAHCDNLINRLRSLNPATEIKLAQDLALESLTYRKAILDHAQKMQHFLPNQFTKLIKDRKLTFENLLEEYKVKLKLTKPFKELSDIEKLQVYESIVEAAGRGKPAVTYTIEALGAVGAAVLVFTAGAMVWDIFTAEDKIEAVVKDISGILLTQLDLTALSTAAIEAGLALVDVEVAGAALTVAGTVVGLGIGALIGIAISALLDLIFSSGTTKVLTTQGLIHCYVSPMPNGVQLARIIKANNP